MSLSEFKHRLRRVEEAQASSDADFAAPSLLPKSEIAATLLIASRAELEQLRSEITAGGALPTWEALVSRRDAGEQPSPDVLARERALAWDALDGQSRRQDVTS